MKKFENEKAPKTLAPQGFQSGGVLQAVSSCAAKFGFTLAEGATHVAQPKNVGKAAFTKPSRGTSDSERRTIINGNRVFRFDCERCRLTRGAAFTLAEVLITLGIIGVVAAITMPTLIQNHKNQETVARLQKSISVLNNGVHKMMADEEVELMEYLELNTCNPTVVSTDGSTQSCLKPYFTKYFNILKDNAGLSSSSTEFYPWKDVKTLKGVKNIIIGQWGVTGYYCFITSDSIMYCPYSYAFGGRGSGLVDINGSKGPNQIGRDIFLLDRKENGTYVPRGGDTWDDSSSDDYCNPESGKGYGCAARILHDGWKIKY